MADPAPALSAQAIVDPDGLIWLPYDLPWLQHPASSFTELSTHLQVHNANLAPVQIDYDHADTLHIINGMGVALGDSVIGLSVLHGLKQRYPHLQVVLYRSPNAPSHVQEIYPLVRHFVEVRSLPVPVATLCRSTQAWVDLADFMYRPGFNQQPMHAFFASSLGIDPASLSDSTWQNQWLQDIECPPLPAWLPPQYTLICHKASTALRTMPESVLYPLAQRLIHSATGPVAGFAALDLPGWHDLSCWSDSLPRFLATIRGASRLISTDSAAIHLAAGLQTPCHALFMGIDPALRTVSYPLCTVEQLDWQGKLGGLHHAGSLADEIEAQHCWARWQGQAAFGNKT